MNQISNFQELKCEKSLKKISKFWNTIYYF